MHLETLQINNKDLTKSLITPLNWSCLSLPKSELGQNLNELKSSIGSGLSSASDSSFDSLEMQDNLMNFFSSSTLSKNIHLTTPN
jgi:hypothetical protein